MKLVTGLAYGFLLALLVSGNASAWFIFIPGSAIQRALETDPDSITVSFGDRALGKCAGLHVNQAQKFSTNQSSFPAGAEDSSPRPESAETVFHANMADVAAEKAFEKDKVRDLARAYSTRWGRVAGADLNANRAYGADLARNCIQNDIPIRIADYPAWQTRQDEKKLRQMDEERRRAEEMQQRLRVEEEARRASLVRKETPPPDTPAIQTLPPSKNVDFTAEARKAARILSCATEDVRVIGIDGQNILFSADCEAGQTLVLTCDRSGLCLRK